MSVLVLMSAYNGENYIEEQLDSLLGQDYKNIHILIRDDGSSDQTPMILDAYSRQNSIITWYRGDNIGVQASFFDLISKAPINYDYYALADQDDWWLNNKISSAVAKLEGYPQDIPRLYCGNKTIVDKNRIPINVTVSTKLKKVSFGNALVQCMCTGCTAVMNKSLLLLVRVKIPEFVIMHDWWIYLVATCFGEVVYDSKSYIEYRQHGNNTSGAMLNKKDLFKYRFHQLRKPRGNIYRQIREFQKIYFLDLQDTNGPLSVQYSTNKQINKALLNELLCSEKSIYYRFKTILDNRIYRQKKTDNLVLKFIILIGKL